METKRSERGLWLKQNTKQLKLMFMEVCHKVGLKTPISGYLAQLFPLSFSLFLDHLPSINTTENKKRTTQLNYFHMLEQNNITIVIVVVLNAFYVNVLIQFCRKFRKSLIVLPNWTMMLLLSEPFILIHLSAFPIYIMTFWIKYICSHRRGKIPRKNVLPI